MKFRKKPVVVDAIQWTGKNTEEIEKFVGKKLKKDKVFSTIGIITLLIPTLESPHEASVGDWIIKGVEGEFYPCKPDIFVKTYDEEETRSCG